jgi:uncharacterized membrane protein YkoI
MGPGCRSRLLGLAAAAMLALVAPLVPVEADHEQARAMRKRGEIVPLQQILDQLPCPQRGRLIEAELEREHERWVYELEILDDRGVVHEHYYDARTGERLDLEDDDQ